MRRLLWIGLFLLGLAGVTLPLVYLYGANQLPPLESELDLERLLRTDVEGALANARVGHFASKEDRKIAYARPQFSVLPQDLLALYLSGFGCEDFFRQPRESKLRWHWRLLMQLFQKPVEGGGRCEALFARRLARRIGAEPGLQLWVAADKIRSMLQKDQLIAYDLSAIEVAEGVIGVEAIATDLFRRPLAKLKLSELAELELVLPPLGYYRTLHDCQNPSLIQENRNHLLEALVSSTLVPEARVKPALAEPVFCSH